MTRRWRAWAETFVHNVSVAIYSVIQYGNQMCSQGIAGVILIHFQYFCNCVKMLGSPVSTVPPAYLHPFAPVWMIIFGLLEWFTAQIGVQLLAIRNYLWVHSSRVVRPVGFLGNYETTLRKIPEERRSFGGAFSRMTLLYGFS